MTRRRSSTSRRSVRPDPMTRALSIQRAVVHVVALFGGIGLLVTLPSIGGGSQLVVSRRLAF